MARLLFCGNLRFGPGEPYDTAPGSNPGVGGEPLALVAPVPLTCAPRRTEATLLHGAVAPAPGPLPASARYAFGSPDSAPFAPVARWRLRMRFGFRGPCNPQIPCPAAALASPGMQRRGLDNILHKASEKLTFLAGTL